MISYNFATKLISILPTSLIPTGSYKRQHKQLYDLDFLTVENLNEVFDELQNNKYFMIKHIISSGSHYFSFIIIFKNRNIEINIWKTKPKYLLFAKISRDYSKIINIVLRKNAKKKHLILNNKGLFNENNQRIQIKTKKELFNYLGVKYLKPEEDNH
jgi:DNA polymerase/3'-5' exonuclease PolX